MNGPMRAAQRRKPALETSLEDFVIWAYRDQQVDQMTASPPAPFAVPVHDAARSRIRHRIDLHWYRVTGARPRIARGESAELVEVAPGEWDLGCRACAILYYPPPAYVDAVRAEYAAWHGA